VGWAPPQTIVVQGKGPESGAPKASTPPARCIGGERGREGGREGGGERLGDPGGLRARETLLAGPGTGATPRALSFQEKEIGRRMARGRERRGGGGSIVSERDEDGGRASIPPWREARRLGG
jgi:hypothetical protein